MKLIIQPKAQIGAMSFDIVWCEKILKKMDLVAHVSSIDQKIYLSHRHLDQEWINLLHEVFHGIIHSFDLDIEDDKIERYISSFAHGMAIFLNSLGVEPDFSQIPEE